jgi:hypothetical protein
MSDPCEHRRARRLSRRARVTSGHSYARAGRASTTTTTRQGWFAHRCGVSRCRQVFAAARLSTEEITWRGDD